MTLDASLATLTFSSPIGRLRVRAGADFVREVKLRAPPTETEGPSVAMERCNAARREIEEYLAGERRVFTVPVAPHGTEFQLRIWEAMEGIPWGETLSYGEIAKELDNPGAVRAVGRACGANPIPLIIPCHRVLARGGRLGGFSGGLEVKQWLLHLETIGRPPSRPLAVDDSISQNRQVKVPPIQRGLLG